MRSISSVWGGCLHCPVLLQTHVPPYKRPKPIVSVRGCIGNASQMMPASGFAQEPIVTRWQSVVGRFGLRWWHLSLECRSGDLLNGCIRRHVWSATVVPFHESVMGYLSMRGGLIRQALPGGPATSPNKPGLRCNLPCIRTSLPLVCRWANYLSEYTTVFPHGNRHNVHRRTCIND